MGEIEVGQSRKENKQPLLRLLLNLALGVILLFAVQKLDILSRNPILPLEEFIPDESIRFNFSDENRRGAEYFSLDHMPDEDALVLFLDVSYTGELRVVSRDGLDSQSWGIFVYLAPPEGELSLISPFLGSAHIATLLMANEIGALSIPPIEMPVIWGPIDPSIPIFIATNSWEIMQSVFEPDLNLQDVYPLDNPDFYCEEITSEYIGIYLVFEGSYVCKYIGADS